MPEMTTLVEALERLRADGYRADFSARGGALACVGGDHLIAPEEIEVEVTYRFEGDSNPDDEAAAFGVYCRSCDLRGVYVVAYGPSMSADDAAILPRLLSSTDDV